MNPYHQQQQHSASYTASARYYPQQYGLEEVSSRSILRQTPPSNRISSNSRNNTPKPLVLDASSGVVSHAHSPNPTTLRNTNGTSTGANHNYLIASTQTQTPTPSGSFLRNIWKERRPQHQLSSSQHSFSSSSPLSSVQVFAAPSLSSCDSIHSTSVTAAAASSTSHQLYCHSNYYDSPSGGVGYVVDGRHHDQADRPSTSTSSIRNRGNYHACNHNNNNNSRASSTANATVAAASSSTALVSPQAGFLSKLGQNVPLWKRRFFVLERPRALLYYFLSPHDTAPRGCLDLEGAQIHVYDDDDDDDDNGNHQKTGNNDNGESVWRFELYWPDNNIHNNNNNGQQQEQGIKCVQLEARSKQARDDWVRALRQHQFATVEKSLQQCQLKVSAQSSRIGELERTLQNYKLVEQELQASQQDCKEWKTKFLELDEAVRKLQQHLVRQQHQTTTNDKVPSTSALLIGTQPESLSTRHAGASSDSKTKAALVPAGEDDDAAADDEDHCATTKEQPTLRVVAQQRSDGRRDDDKSPIDIAESRTGESSTGNSSMREMSLLDVSVNQENNNCQDEPTTIDVWNVPGTHFAGLYNTCEQLQQTVRLSQVEATQAVSDCSQAQTSLEAMEKRMAKAEKHLCKLWEENCALRKVLKQKKRERQVLVREVKNLREAAVTRAADSASRWNPSKDEPGTNNDPSKISLDDEDEEQLMNELEAHVLSSIRLHEQLLLASPVAPSTRSGHNSTSSAPSEQLVDTARVIAEAREGTSTGGVLPDSRSASVATTATATSASAATTSASAAHDAPVSRRQPIASLLDDSSESEDDEDDCDGCDDGSVAPSISSMDVEAASLGVESPSGHNSTRVVRMDLAFAAVSSEDALTSNSNHSVSSTPDRRNPLLELDETASSKDDHQSTDFASHQSASVPTPVITSNGQATSKLHCPFADVVEPTRVTSNVQRPYQEAIDELEVYHLTFYTRKIGLQFQKVPPPPARSSGLLTDALTADLRGTSNTGGSKTASELRRIAAVSTRAKSSCSSTRDEEVCPVAAPIDAVVVCGFVGFDDSGTNVRPKLGARLVAFDGVSVEVGKWTFDSIRKAIQARDRPLTLSFRNDYLTTEQRAILTKAVADVQSACPPPRKTLQYPIVQRRPSCDPSVHSALSHESGIFVNDGQTAKSQEDELSGGVSVRSGASTNVDHHYRPSFPQSFSSTKSVTSSGGGRENKYAFRSFSEAGSSVSMISAVAPLVTSLLYRNSSSNNNNEPFTPDYLRRNPEPVEDTPQHQDFQSELL